MSYRSLILADSPSLYWPLDATYGATDQSGNGRDGTGAGGVSIGGYSGSPISGESTSTDFDGSNSAVANMSYSPFTNGQSYTYCGWYNADVVSGWQALLARGSGAQFELALVDSDVLLGVGSQEPSWASAWPGVGQWVHFAVIFRESANTATLYINGAVVSTIAHTGSFGASTGLRVGLWDAADPLNGKLAHVAVWERELTASEIESHYRVGAGEGLVATRAYVHQAGRNQ